MPKFSANLEKTLHRVLELAQNVSHELVTVEHLLLALTDDKDARDAMLACGVNVAHLQTEVKGYLSTGLSGAISHGGKSILLGTEKGRLPQHTPSFQRVILRAIVYAESVGGEEVTGDHVLLSVFSEPDNFASYFLREQAVSKTDIVDYINHKIDKEKRTSNRDRGIASKSGGEPVKLDLGRREHLFFSTPHIVDLSQLTDLGKLGSGSFDKDVPASPHFQSLERERGLSNPAGMGTGLGSGGSRGSMSPSERKKFIETYCVNLNEKAKRGRIDPFIGRRKEIDRIFRILCRRHKNNPLLVGEPGVGKTALVEGLAFLIHSEQVPAPLKGTTIFSLDIGSLLAGTRYRGDFEERFKNLIKAITEYDGAVLFIDEMHGIIGAGAANGSSMDASNLLKPLLSGSRLRVIGSTTHKEYHQFFEKDPTFVRRMRKLVVDEPSEVEALEILKSGPVPMLEDFHKVKFEPRSIEEALKLSGKYFQDRFRPDIVIDILDEAAAAKKLDSDTLVLGAPDQTLTRVESAENTSLRAGEKKMAMSDVTTSGGKTVVIDVIQVQETVAKMAQIKPQRVAQGEGEVLRNMDKILKSTIFGQNRPIEALTDVIRLARAGLKTNGKPIGSYLFSGPTGVGKTEIAIQLSKILEIPLIRFDMSEYMEKHSVARLIGSPPGYVGFEQGGLLTEAITKSPHCVLLLDEIEKAHPDILSILLQIMDYGKLTDHNNKKVDFQNVILIMTSNAGASEFGKAPIGFENRSSINDGESEIKRMFTPEFRNRLDEIIQFSPLSRAVMSKIVDKFIEQLEMQLLEKKVRLRVTSGAKAWLIKEGFDEKLGARPLDRTIQNYVKRPVAKEILFGTLVDGGAVTVGEENGKLTFCFEAQPARSFGSVAPGGAVPQREEKKNSAKSLVNETP